MRQQTSSPKTRPLGLRVGITAAADDLDATDSVTYSLDNNAGGLFTIDGATGVITIAAAIDYEAAVSHTVVVRAASTDGSASTQSFTITVTDVDETDTTPITDTNAVADAVDENAANGTIVGITAFADDADGTDTISYSLDDDAGGRFIIDAATGIVTVNGALDYEAATSHDITVRATSTDASFTTRTFTIAVNDLDEFDVTPLVDTDADPEFVNENAVAGSAVGVQVFSIDNDASLNTVTYSLDNDAGGRFAIDGSTGLVTVATPMDYESATSHTITVRATSADGSTTTQAYTIAVGDVDEFDTTPISDTNAAVDAVDENSAVGTTVGLTAFADDADGTDFMSYSLDDNAGGRFSIDGTTGIVTVAGALDYEANTSHNITVRATSTDASFTTRTFSIAVNDLDEFDITPISDVDAATDSVAENAGIGSDVGITAFASDADASTNTITYSLDDNAGGRFAVDALSGQVAVAGPLNYEAATSHSVTLRATSADGSTATRTFTIAVTDVDEFDVTPLTDTDTGPETLVENNAIGATVGLTVNAVDSDGTDFVSYSIDNDAGGRFVIDATTGVVTAAQSLDRETAGSHTITVRATSTDGSSQTRDWLLTVQDQNDTVPVIAPGQNLSISEHATAGTSAGFATAADPDLLGSLQNWTIQSGNTGNAFAVNSLTGEITLTANGPLNYEIQDTYSLVLTVADGSQDVSDPSRDGQYYRRKRCSGVHHGHGFQPEREQRERHRAGCGAGE